jgi:hypothetical protein
MAAYCSGLVLGRKIAKEFFICNSRPVTGGYRAAITVDAIRRGFA